jgi:hypothetical protein
MQRFRLLSATVAIPEDGKGVAMIPSGAEILAEVPNVAGVLDHGQLIAIQWDGKRASMFLVDLLERGRVLSTGI